MEVEVPEGETPLGTVLSVLQTSLVKKVEAQPQSKEYVVAPITGRVSRILVKEGQRVEKGTTIATMEAMKTLIEVKSSMNGVVKEVLVAEGEVVKQGAPIARIAPRE
ncbi:biotin/lipoyl attachment domain-containing protein [Thermofilum pendens Hrk 5]|uniref:Biotin/lipoyl attachment domain-containing protein n=1 Tax=Thermofilum pendens (strain DSM 2475 / Hrk 5) TaxID=368408 RepID=A1RWI5_THEPD|nr:biotin/lipoyl attachment domain-containing protein [Thermofilum pendens Hrk 5]